MPEPASSPVPFGSHLARSTLVRAGLLAVGGVVAIFLAYELAERLWLEDRYPDSLFLFHRIRGITAAVVAVGLFAGALVRCCPPFIEANAPSRDLRRPPEPRDSRTVHHARWFIGMRWVAVLAALVVVAVVWSPGGAAPLVLLTTVAVLALANGAYTLWLRSGKGMDVLLRTQLYGDVGLIALVIHLSGGLESPLAPLLLFHVFIGGMLLPSTHAYAVAGVGTAFLGAVAMAEWAGALEPRSQTILPGSDGGGASSGVGELPHAAGVVGFHGVLLLVAAHFTVRLAGRLRWDERELARLADEARERRQLLEAALDTTGTALCVSDPHGGPAWMNERWRTWFGGADPALVGGGDPSEAKEGPNGTLTGEPGNEVGPTGRRTRIETRGDRTFRVSSAPVVGSAGRVVHLAGLAQDITEEKRAEEGMIRAERLAAVGELAGKMAHEVNNPAGIIGAKGRLLLTRRRNELSSGAAEEMEKIVRLSERVARVSQGLLSYARPARRSRSTLDLRPLLREALGVIEAPALTAGIRLEDALPRHELVVNGNRDELEQVFMNLLVNGLDAMPGGGVLRVHGAGPGPAPEEGSVGGVEVVVEDTGVGIPDEDRDAVFEPFWTTKPEGKGTGLGLSICLGLVRSHGGEIAMETTPGAGTRVTVALPAAAAAPEEA